MAVEAVGATSSGTSNARIEFVRAQQRITEELAGKSAEKVAAIDRAAITKSDVTALNERQENTGRIGTALDVSL